MTVVERFSVATRADWVSGPGQGHWTYNHYVALQKDGHRYEIVDGVLYMSPSPSEPHQSAAGWFYHYMLLHVQIPGLGRTYIAPLDVELAPNTVVQLDVFVMLNAGRGKITSSRIVGAPDLVIEISSPTTVGYDRREKQDAYARARVSEYWIIDTTAQVVEVLLLEGRGYHSQGLFTSQMGLLSQIVPSIVDVSIEKFFL
ncbi:MAG: Uma2 family endonuclease [Ktedonobacteraceae bacterium]|nr:Uma2 family endonuclease [Ktedonobacteraceae bacterium]